jgi:hypothetical protein
MNSKENTRIEYFLPEDIWRKIIQEYLLTNHKKYWTRFKRNDFMLEDLTKFHLDIYSQKIYNFTTDYLDKEYIVNNVPSICCLAPKLVLETVESLYNLLQCISKKLYILYSRYNIVVKEENYAQRIRYTRIIKDNLFAIERMCEKQREKNWDNWIEKVSGKNRVKTLELLDKIHLKTYEISGEVNKKLTEYIIL